MTFAFRLKQSTDTIHSCLDKHRWFRHLAGPRATVEDYRKYLLGWNAIQGAVESHVFPALTPFHKRLRLDQRARSSHAIEDLKQLGLDAETILRHTPSIPIHASSVAEALGVLYVIEGATLGGAVVKRLLADQHPAWTPTLFLTSYGPHRSLFWKELLTFIENHFQSAPDTFRSAQISAIDTFQQILVWFDRELEQIPLQ